MRIVINTRLWLPEKLEGIGWFVKETTERLVRNHPEHEFHLLFDRPFNEEIIPPGSIPHVVHPPARHPYLFHAWFEYSLPIIFRKIKPDLFLSPDSYLSRRAKVPSIQVLHDLNFEHDRFGIPNAYYRFYRKNFPKYAEKAVRIATVSEYSKLDISKTYGINPDKIDVVYSGLNQQYGPASESTKEIIRAKYSKGKPYFVYVGSLHGRKNVSRLLQAFDLFQERNSTDIRLLIVGKSMFRKDELHAVYDNLKHKSKVDFTGRVSNDDLSDILGSAMSLVFISLFEGFGLPILEAFQSGVPLITSNCTSMPEIAGDAALLVDPHSIEEIAEAMTDMAREDSLREELVKRGTQRKGQFTWDRTSELLWGCVEKAMRNQSL